MNIGFRELKLSDKQEYLDLLFEFTNYKYELSDDEFIRRYDNNKKIIIIFLKEDNTIIGAGTIFKLEKLHNNSISQIEDVIITEKYRGKQLGKLLIDKLINIGLEHFKSYKIILNCLEKNVKFYEKCDFIQVGVEMKYNK